MRFLKNASLMRKLVLYFLAIILLMFSLNAFSINRFKSFYSSFYEMLNDSVKIQSLSTDLDGVYNQVENYAHSGSEEYIKDYAVSIRRMVERVEELKAAASDKPELAPKFRDIRNMLLTFNEKGKSIIAKYDAGTGQIYINQAVAELSRIKGYTQDEIKGLLLVRLKNLLDYYSGFWINIRTGEGLMYVLTGLVTALCLFFAFTFSRQISVPIHQLVLRLKRVAKGELDVESLKLKTNDEIHVLIDSFNHMISQIRGLIGRMREKADVERQLKEQEIKNLEVLNLLNRSELNFLQSQINPHFLFNTLNSIAVLADIEEASQTKMMIENMSSILRYNLRRMNDTVTLREELEIVMNYISIQRMRYGNRIEYVVDTDESVMNCFVPSMILQPFVENAILHGLEPKEGNGRLELRVHDCGDTIEIHIQDDGVGMTPEKLNHVMGIRLNEEDKRGIGVANVMRRLEIYYGKDVFSAQSSPGGGTSIRMRLPRVMNV